MANSLLIRDVTLEGRRTNVFIDGNRFSDLNAPADTVADKTFDAKGLAMLPSFFNTHTHAAMSLLRGYADDMELFTWLNEHIWPYEAKMTDEAYYAGTRLAILEMLKSGTTFFADMYFHEDQVIQAVSEMGIRTCFGLTIMDRTPKDVLEASFKKIEDFKDPTGGRIQLMIAPHAIYTCSADLLKRASEFSKSRNIPMTIHISETAQEVKDCIAQHGVRPVVYLDQLGVLYDKLVVAHCVHVNDEEIEILRERGVQISHNPVSNMKLSSGIFRSKALLDAGCHVCLGTDGCSSNNNLDMREEMKFAAMLAKVENGPECMDAETVLRCATRNGAEAFGIDAGVIAKGKLADCVLVDLDNERLVPCHNLVSNYVYAADSRAIDTVICDGRILVEHGHVEGEEEILEAARRIA